MKKKILIFISAIIFLLISVIIFLNIFLNEKRVSSFINNYLTNQFGVIVEIKDININFPFNLNIGFIQISDSHNDILMIKKLAIELNPNIDFLHKIRVKFFNIEELYLNNIPDNFLQKGKASKNNDFENSKFVKLIPKIEINEFSIKNIIINKKIVKVNEDLNIGLNSEIFLDTKSKILNFKGNLSSSYLNNNINLDFIDGFYEIVKNELKIDSNITIGNIFNSKIKSYFNFKDNKTDIKLEHNINLAHDNLDVLPEKVKLISDGKIEINGNITSPQIFLNGNINIKGINNDDFKIFPINYSSNIKLKDLDSFDGEINIEQGSIKGHGNISYMDNIFSLKEFIAKGQEFEKIINISFNSKSKKVSGDSLIREKDKIIKITQASSTK